MSQAQGLSEKQFLVDFTTRLKQVLHPTISQEEYQGKYGIRLKTDISSTTTDIISFYIKCLDLGLHGRKTIYQIGYIQTSPKSYCTSNLGSSKIGEIGIVVEDSKYNIILVPSDPSNSTILKTEAEVFVSTDDKNNIDNKNHISAIEYITRDKHDEYESQGILEDVTEGELDINFNYVVHTGPNGADQVIIQNGDSGEIDTIHHSVDATQLDHNIDITINENDSSETIYGSGTLDTSSDSCDIDVTINTEEIVDQVLQDLDLPDATDNQKGVIALAGNLSLGSDTRIPVETINVNGLNRAFIDASKIDIQNQDIHRYANMNTAPKVSGFIVQYIGKTTSDYTNGYFYQFIPTNFAVSKTDTKWIYSSTVENTGLGIAQYNANLNYLITFGNLEISIQAAVGQTTIADDTRFLISQNGSDLAELTYAELKQYFKIERNPNYLSDLDADFVLVLEEVENAFEWRQKNVQPMMSVDAPLVYKGSITANTGETDIQALQRQILNPEQGWVYTVLPSKQEYFWNGNEWEYMGQLIDVPEYTAGDAIDINNNNDISVLFDGSSIWIEDYKLCVASNLYIDGNDNISIEEKEENERAISVLGYKWDPDYKSFAEGKFSSSQDSPAQGSYSHTEGRETKTRGQASHAEGYNTIAYGKASHAEGFGILFNTGSSGFSWEEIENSYGNLKITITTQNGASQKTILTLIRELYFIKDKGFSDKEIYSRETKQKSGFSIEHLEINEIEFDPTDSYSDPYNPITDGEIFLDCFDTSILVDEGTLDIIVPVYSDNQSSHAEGKNTQASGKNAHVEGLVNYTEGENSHVEGHLNYINSAGYNAHAEGYNTRALKNQAHSEGANTQAYGENSHVEGEETCAWGKDSHAEGKSSNSPAMYDDNYFNDTETAVYNQWKTHHTSSTGNYSCAWGNASHLEGKDNLALGNNSHAEGQATCAYGNKSHAEGYGTLAKENNSHAEGDESEATGLASHAEGQYTIASGDYSHAEGRSFSKSQNNQYMTVASGSCSHSEGYITHAQNESEHAEGHCNKSHKASDTYGNAGNTQHSIGIGTISYYHGGINFDPKNAFEVMQNGEIYVYGVGGYDGVHIKSETGHENTKTLQEVLGTSPSAQVQSDWNQTDNTAVDYIKNKPTIPAAQVNADWTASSGVSAILHKPTLATVATSGSYNDLSDKPTIPSNTLTGVTFNGTSATVSGGIATIKDNEVITSNQPTTITYNTSKYIKKSLTGGSFAITVDTTGTGITDNGAKEIIYRIDNSTSDATITVTGGINMFDSDLATGLTLPAGKTMELVFTFWNPTDVTFNGGISV